ncbi:MAG: hypothetical protein LQ338_005968, partial [Usnochroma carphineum]
MDELLVPVSSRTTSAERGQHNQPRIVEVGRKQSGSLVQGIQSSEQTLNVLRSHPHQEALSEVLEWLSGSTSGKPGLDINSQTPQSSQIIHALVNDILPDWWRIIRGDKSGSGRNTREMIVSILSNVGGISALVMRMRIIIDWKDDPGEKDQIRLSGRVALLKDLVSVLEFVLEQDNFLLSVWQRLAASISHPNRRWLLWKEMVALLGDGRVLSITSQADEVVAQDSSTVRERSWLSDGSKYSSWMGRNLSRFIVGSERNIRDLEKTWAQMLERAMTLGHADQLVEANYDAVIHGVSSAMGDYSRFMAVLKSSTMKAVISSLLRSIAKIHLSTSNDLDRDGQTSRSIGGIAALVQGFVNHNRAIKDMLLEWLSGDGLLQDLRVRRAVVAGLAEDTGVLKTALSDSLRAFGDKMHIKHTPILHQEGTTENLLLLMGCAYRKDPRYVAHTAQSSLYLNAISNRLAASSPRASVLGMYVGTAVSELVDPPDKRMNFSSDDLKSIQAQRYLNLTTVRDSPGSIEDLKHDKSPQKQAVSRVPRAPAAQQVKPIPSNSQASKGSKIISIEEVEDEFDSEDDDLPTYAKPDSDRSDSDDDPTVLNRDKPAPPVYIDDLISSLRDTENYDRHTLALTHASSLIRRKASFGTEVTDNIQDLASILTGLQDKWNLENFEELRLQGMIAVLVAQPLEMGQWFSATYFNGDYSISQRAAVLTTLSLGARELAGYGKEDAALTKSTQDTSFPSKHLPPKLHALYASPDTAPITAASKQLEQSILRPMALGAADALSGPNALKIRTFSSRMEVEKKRTRPIPNALAKVVADGFFFPLVGRWSMHVQGFGASSSSPLVTTPLLPLYLRTLSLLLHASGPSTLSLPQLTHEFLLLLLSLRRFTGSSLPTLEAFLFAFLTVLEVNSDREGQRRLATDNAREVMELMSTAEAVFER